MGLFSSDARQFKFDILREVSEETFNGDLSDENIFEYAKKLIPGTKANYRCCVYKEREVLRQRARLAMGKMANDEPSYDSKKVVQVIEAACDGCTIMKIQITDNCRKCMAKPCLSACKFGAIHMGRDRAVIDYEKCKECGLCVKVCPFSAIITTERPCYAACPVNAIGFDENGIAVIDYDKCINCAQCQIACPFGAVEDISWVVPVIQLMKMDVPMYAIIAPAIQGQFESATLPQIKKGIEMLGFKGVYEAAIGADAVAYEEETELLEHIKAGKPLTTSCCPAFVNMAKLHFPTVYENNVSTLLSPMMALAKKLKHDHPEAGIVFIGPCVAKKQEATESFSSVDFVLTFEEILAMLIAKRIDPQTLEAKEEDYPSIFGRNFAQGGGVSKAVIQAAKEKGHEDFTGYYADGSFECKKQLTLIKVNKFNYNILEGMSCPGGCIAGPATIEDPNVIKGRMAKENLQAEKKTIEKSLEIFDFTGINIHR